MPRANRHIQPGHTYHVTHRCHNRCFLLKFARDRQEYRGWLREGLARQNVRILNYCITSNHVHLLVRTADTQELGRFMQFVAGGMAQSYNQRKRRTGAFWSDRYHASMIEDGPHLWRCMRYVDLNMVRAGVVTHPSEWEWTGCRELMGERRRNRVLDMKAVLDAVDMPTVESFRQQYNDSIEDALRRGQSGREPWWSESVAVGSVEFVAKMEECLHVDYKRRRTRASEESEGAWVLREAESNYTAQNEPGNRAIALFPCGEPSSTH